MIPTQSTLYEYPLTLSL